MPVGLPRCVTCGTPLSPDAPVCPHCGAAPPDAATRPLTTTAPVETRPLAPPAPPGDTLTWDYDIPLLTNPAILRDFVLVIGLSVVLMEGLVAAMSFFFTDETVWLPWELWAIGVPILVVLFLGVALLLYGNRFHARFTLDPDGVTYAVGGKERRITRWVAVIGLLFGGWRAIGPALLATSREVERVEWREVVRVRVDPARRVIALSNAWRTVLRLYCPPDQFAAIQARVETGAARGAAWRAEHPTPPLPGRPILFYAGWVALTAAATLAALAWPWTGDDGPDRWGLLAGLLVLLLGLTNRAWWSRLVALAAVAAGLLFLLRLGVNALEPFQSFSGEIHYTYMLDTELLVVAAAGGLALLALCVVGFHWGGQPLAGAGRAGNPKGAGIRD